MTAFPQNLQDVNNGINSGNRFRPVPTSALLVLPRTTVGAASATQAEIDASVGFIWNADPDALTSCNPGMFYADPSAPGTLWVGNAAGTDAVKWMENGVIVATITADSLDLGDNDPINFGDANDIVMKWNGTYFAVTQATANSEIRLGVSGAGIDVQMFGDTVGADFLWDQSADSAKLGDNAKLTFGTGVDISFLWDGTDLLVSQALADSTIKWGVAGAGINHVFYGDTTNRDLVWDQTNNQLRFDDNTVLGIGTGGGALSDIQMSWNGTKMLVAALTADSAIDYGVDGAGIDQNWYGDTASAKLAWDQSQDALIRSGAAVDLYSQGAGSTGTVFEVIGVDLTHGVKRTAYSATISPAAVETALFTVPAQSVIESVQASIVTALTGGGTTVTASIGITGDVDLYGTMTNAGVQADLLTQNAKMDCFGRRAANAGAGIGLYVAATQALKLIAAATGGASAGDTALTAGSIKIRVVYSTMMSLADGA